jgi:peptide/nickel transport system substrate-binding protein
MVCCPPTPKDTLVVAWAIDDIITMDPAKPSRSRPARSWAILRPAAALRRGRPVQAGRRHGQVLDRVADGKTYTFELKPGLKFASGNPLTAEDVVWSLQRAVLLDKTPAFILTQFGFTKDNVKDKIKQTGPLTLTLLTDKPYAPTFVLNCLTANVAAIVDKKLVLSKEKNGDWATAG